MVTTGKENVQAILQGKCTECGSSDDNYKVVGDDHTGSGLSYELVCDCGAEASIRITTDGVSADDTVSYEEASWHQPSSSEESDEEEMEEDEGLNRDSDKQI